MERLLSMVARLSLSTSAAQRLIEAILLRCLMGRATHEVFSIMKASTSSWSEKSQLLISKKTPKMERERRVGMSHIVCWNGTVKR